MLIVYLLSYIVVSVLEHHLVYLLRCEANQNHAVGQQLVDLPVHVVPTPVYPSLHVHVNDPTVFAHAALSSQLLSAGCAHSSTSKDKHRCININQSKKIFHILTIKYNIFQKN